MGVPTPKQASGYPGLGPSIPSLFEEPGLHMEMSQATLRKCNFIPINTGETPILGQLKEGLGPQRN